MLSFIKVNNLKYYNDKKYFKSCFISTKNDVKEIFSNTLIDSKITNFVK